jgi:hypothetical protein
VFGVIDLQYFDHTAFSGKVKAAALFSNEQDVHPETYPNYRKQCSTQ